MDNCPKYHHPLIHGAAPVFVGAAVVGYISPTVLLQIVPLVAVVLTPFLIPEAKPLLYLRDLLRNWDLMAREMY